ncbi:MAG: DUF1080 domain-containing protein [Candidatus Hydrogenedentota bacterium]
MHTRYVIAAILAAAFLLPLEVMAEEDGEWIELFNGEDLDAWTPKFRGHEAGVNYNNTFRVEDGLLRVSYDEYDSFDSMFGHLIHEDTFSHYRLRVEYRFVGEQVENGPGWAFRNNGLMLHGQTPESMGIDQSFPVSIEAQLLGGDGGEDRPTLAVCTPGTHFTVDGEVITQHCTDPQVERTFHGDDWVTVEIEVRGNEVIRHIHDGEVLMEYNHPQLDPNDADAAPLVEERDGDLMLEEGTISIQAESHPTDFRTIEIMPLEP